MPLCGSADPVLKRPIGLLSAAFAVNLLLTTLGTAPPAPFKPVQQPNPRVAARPTVGFTADRPQFYVDQGGGAGGGDPLVESRWSAPRVQFHPSLALLTATVQVPFAQTEWTTPRALLSTRPGEPPNLLATTLAPTIADAPTSGNGDALVSRLSAWLTFSSAPSLSLLAAPVVTLPPTPALLQLPRASARPQVFAPLNLLTTTLATTDFYNVVSFGAPDTAKRATRVQDPPNLLTGTLNVPVVQIPDGEAVTTLPAPARRAALSWSQHRFLALVDAPTVGAGVAPVRIEPIRSVRWDPPLNLLTGTLAPAPADMPFSEKGWSNPSPSRRAQDAGQQTARPQFYVDAPLVGSTVLPVRFDQARGLVIVDPPSLLMTTLVIAESQPFGASLLSPVGRIAALRLVEVPNLLVGTLAPATDAPFVAAWENPRGKTRAIQTSPLGTLLEILPPGSLPVVQSEWPNPRIGGQNFPSGWTVATPGYYRDAALPSVIVRVRSWPSIILVRPC